MHLTAKYPTPEHERAATAILDFFSTDGPFEAVLLVNSCARGKATRDSCLDINVLARPEVLEGERPVLERAWEEFYNCDYVFKALRNAGKFSEVHLDITDGQF